MWVCKEPTCANPLKSFPMALNNYYWILIKITTAGYSTWKLINPTVTIFGSTTSFPVYVPPSTDINNAVSGQVIIKMKQTFALNSFTVQVITDSSPPARRLLQETNNTTTQSYQSTSATKSNVTLDCVLEKETDTVCPSCLKQYCLNQGQFVDGQNCNAFDISKGYNELCSGSEILALFLISLILM